MRRAARSFILATLALAPACSHPSSGNNSLAAPRPKLEMLSMQEIGDGSNFTNVYDMLSQKRPRWLESRSTDAANQTQGNVMVRVNDVEYGPAESLRSLSTYDITAIRFFDPASATQRWGTQYAHGAIVITIRPMRQ